MKKFPAVAALVALGVFSSAASATILTFDFPQRDSSCQGDGCIPMDYGNRVSSGVDSTTGYSYGEGNGFTPNVSITYIVPNGYYDSSFWAVGYAQLLNALGNYDYDVPFELVFTADPGYTVTLNSFDIAGWDGDDYQTQISIFDDNGSLASPNLFSTSTLVPGANAISPLSSPLVANGALHLFISNIGSTGIDNINFDQTPRALPPGAVSSPATVWLFGAAVFGLLGRMRRG